MAQPLNIEAFTWATGAFCQLNRIPHDAALLIKHYPPPYDIVHLQQALHHFGLNNSRKRYNLNQLPQASMPCLAILNPIQQSRADSNNTVAPVLNATQLNSSTTSSTDSNADSLKQSNNPALTSPSDAPANQNYDIALILSRDDQRLLVLYPNQAEPVTVSIDDQDFNARITGDFLMVRKAEEALTDEDGVTQGNHSQTLQAKTNASSNSGSNNNSTNQVPEKAFGFRWFIPELLKYKKIWSEVLLATLTIQLVGLAVPICTQIVIDKVVVHHTTSTLIVIGVALFIFLIFSAIMGWVRQYLVLHTGNRIDATLGHKVFSHLLDLPVRYYDHRPTGVIIARVHGVETIREFLAGGLVTLLLDLPFLIVFLAIMFWYSWQLTLIAVAILTLISLLSFFITPIIRAKLNHQFMLGARNQAFLTEYVSGMETVKSLQMEPQLKQTFGNYLSTYLNASFDSRKLSISYNTAANTLDQLQTLAILCVGAWLVMHNTSFTIGMLVAFQMFSGRLSQPVMRLVGLWQEFQQADIAVKRLGDVMNAPAEPMTLIPTRANTNATTNITVDSLGFRYTDAQNGTELPWLYRNLTFNIQAGHCVVVMGLSGCGKSTLAKLLLGFYQPQEGHIKLNGQDIKYLAANELRNHFGVVPQETVLFSGTIYDNLILANPHASFEQIIQACQLAEIHQAIEQLPQGYQTQIGEHGTGLSGGQKQRIAIARALLKQPKVLIFDEAVSNLDQQTAEHFAQTVNKLKGKVTILFITHQLPKGLNVDEAVILGKDSISNDKQMSSEKV
ncbi:MAG: peptidase domain-containing ABC transporter [Methylotenera sp.]|nr:peptidase domain-containing ABC transporter [Methylotenera sp.]MDD4925377.1 peptidase domain-containing ABC transporter [Methylotenera sp.]